MDKKCEETEAFYRFNPKQAHKRIKELKRKEFTNSSGIIKDKDETISFEENDIKRRWLEYVKELYDEPNRFAPLLSFKEPTTFRPNIYYKFKPLQWQILKLPFFKLHKSAICRKTNSFGTFWLFFLISMVL